MVSAALDLSPDLRSRFEALVVPHLDRLLAFAIRRSDSVADAEDAVQEAFVRAWLGFADLRDDSLARPSLAIRSDRRAAPRSAARLRDPTL